MTHANAQPAVIYCRSATAPNPKALAEQETVCRAHAESNGLTVLDVFSDMASGNTLDRPGFTRMLDYLVNAADGGNIVVLVAEASRLARDIGELQKAVSLVGQSHGSLFSVSDGLLSGKASH